MYFKISAAAALPMPAAGVMLEITASGLNLRPDPSTQNPPLAVLHQGTPLVTTGIFPVGDWIQVMAHGLTGWVSMKYTRPIVPSTAAPLLAPLPFAPSLPSVCPPSDILLSNIMSALASGNIQIEKEWTQANKNRIVIFSDKRGLENQKFLLKQTPPDTSTYDKFSQISDALGARIANEAGIPMNCVSIIPATLDFALKPISGYPATLHTFVVGTPPKSINIQQTGGRGLTLEIIRNMSLSPDLPKITVFDTFLPF